MSLTHYSNKFLFCFFRATADGSLVFFLPSHYYYYLLRKESRPCFRNSSRFAESTERKGDAYTENGRIFFPYFGGDRVLYKIVHTQPKVFHKSCANLPGDTHKLQGEMKGGKNKKLWTWKVVRKYNRRWIVLFFFAWFIPSQIRGKMSHRAWFGITTPTDKRGDGDSSADGINL